MKAFLFVCTSTLSIFLLLYVVAAPLVIPVAPVDATSVIFANDARRREANETVETCRRLLGWTEGTIIREPDMAAFALCLHPTLKKHNLLTK